MGFVDLLQYLVSFAFVIALLLGLLYALRKLQTGSVFAQRGQRLQIVEAVSLGPRQKVVLVRVDDHEVLLGVSAAQINLLDTLSDGALARAAALEPLTVTAQNPLQPLASSFAEAFATFRAKRPAADSEAPEASAERERGR